MMSRNIKLPVTPHTATVRALPKSAGATAIMAICISSILSFSACKSNEKPAQQATTSGIQGQEAVKVINDSLQSQFNAASAKLDQMTTEKSKLDSELKLKNVEIAKLQGQVGHLSKENKVLLSKLKKDAAFITSLKSQLSDKAKEYAQQLGLLQSGKDDATHQNEELMKKYNALRELGSVLDASNIRLEPIHTKHHGKKEKETSRARRVDIFRIMFDIDENRIAEDGLKKLYVVINDPDGKLLSNTETTSGTITGANGTSINYSVLKEIQLRQNEAMKNITVDWTQDDDYKKGEYTIGIYNGGYRIGGGKVTLR